MQASPSSNDSPPRRVASDPVGRVYAASLFELAQSHDQLDAVAEEVGELASLLADQPAALKLLSTPALDREQRKGVLQRLFEGNVSDLLHHFLQVVNQNDRLGSLPSILSAFDQRMAAHRNVLNVDAQVAGRLDEATADRVAQGIGQATGKNVTFHQVVDPALIGGIKVRIGDQLIDASVASRLRRLEQQLVTAGRGRAGASTRS